jgi:hypothetical protein
MTAAGQRRELARYQLADGTRAVVAQRIDGRVAISDVPVDHADRVYPNRGRRLWPGEIITRERRLAGGARRSRRAAQRARARGELPERAAAT